jgi:hypothetical protein
MKLLIAISSCELFERNGSNDACRETWIAEAIHHPDVDVRFFIGSQFLGDPGPSGDVCGNLPTDAIAARIAAQDGPGIAKGDPGSCSRIVLIDCRDDYGHLTSKTQVSLRWAQAHDYDFVFRCFPDTYVRIERLLTRPFTEFDYYGDFRNEFLGKQNYASGGAGYVLSRKAYTHLLDAPITGVWRDDITPYAEDLWVGNRLGFDWPAKKLKYFDDTTRFLNKGQSYWPNKNNQVVTSHLSAGSPHEKYRKEMMYDCHKSWEASHAQV